jgi:membrane protein DedA with SNARE-associated domain
LAWAGFLLGENWEDIRDWMRPADIPIIVAVLVLFGWWLYRHVKRVWGEPEPSGPEA